MSRPFVNFLLQPAFGEAFPQPSRHVGDINAVVRLVVLQADAFAESLGNLKVIIICQQQPTRSNNQHKQLTI